MSTSAKPQQSKNFLSDYRTVNQRIQEFYSKYPDGRIITNLIESLTNIDLGVFVVRAELYRGAADTLPFATGIAIETPTSGYVNKQGFALENAETSSIGRALQNAGFVTKASDMRPEEAERMKRASGQGQDKPGGDLATPKQLDAIAAISKAKGIDVERECIAQYNCDISELTRAMASGFLDYLKNMKSENDGIAPRVQPAAEKVKDSRAANKEQAVDFAVELGKAGHPDFQTKGGITTWLRSLAAKKWSIQIDPQKVNSGDDLPDDLLAELPKELEAELKTWREKQNAPKDPDDECF